VKKKKSVKLNGIKKCVKDFIKDEEGFISRENMLKIGLGTVSALGILASMPGVATSRSAHTNHSSHANTIAQPTYTKAGLSGTQVDHCWTLAIPTHVSHGSHASHDSY